MECRFVRGGIVYRERVKMNPFVTFPKIKAIHRMSRYPRFGSWFVFFIFTGTTKMSINLNFG